MYQVRFHGRGGQGMKTASHILGTAFFLSGYQVQDAPRYGAERRGAPIFAYVRADKEPIYDRGIILYPDLIIVADDSLLHIPAAGTLNGLNNHTMLLIVSHHSAEYWQKTLSISNHTVILTPANEKKDSILQAEIGTLCAAGAARLSGQITRQTVQSALETELHDLKKTYRDRTLIKALETFDNICDDQGPFLKPIAQSEHQVSSAEWITLPFEAAEVSAPSIRTAANSLMVNTGTWRTLKPVIDYENCHRCHWVCSTFCPDSCIEVDETGYPQINYDQCKGCMICVNQCPPKAIHIETEQENMEEPAP